MLQNLPAFSTHKGLKKQITRTILSYILLIFLVFFSSVTVHSSSVPSLQPHLTIVLVLDQFRHDYLTRYHNHFLPPITSNGNLGGFRYIMEHGAVFTNTRYNHIPTHTAVGHAAIASGSPPYKSGIIGNKWYNRKDSREEYCVMDNDYKNISFADDIKTQGTSPKNLRSSTISDELKLATGGQAKVVSISIKDRSAVIMGGHKPDLSVWFSTKDGAWTSSRYYFPDGRLPLWIEEANKKIPINKYLGKKWELYLPIHQYIHSRKESVTSQGAKDESFGKTFPHYPSLDKKVPDQSVYESIISSPFGNELLIDFAIEAMKQEKLGQDSIPDFLSISFSSTDIVGHLFGPSSIEMEDLAIRTDRTLSRLFNFIQHNIQGGIADTLIVLTSDHGTMDLPEALSNYGINAGRAKKSNLKKIVSQELSKYFGNGEWVLSFHDPNLYLNYSLLNEKNVPLEKAEQLAAVAALKTAGVASTFTRTQIIEGNLSDNIMSKIIARSYDPERGGDVVALTSQHWNWLEGERGTMHGSAYSYDTHVPLIIAGPGIKPGWYHANSSPEDIAPTLATLLHTEMPSGSEGRILSEALLSNSQNSLQEEINRIIADPRIQETSVGLAVRDLKTGKIIAGYQENKLFIPASVQKLITWGAALNTFGPDHQFATSIRYDPNAFLHDGILAGKLVLEGGGDPLLSINNLGQMAYQLYEKGVRKIRGEIVIDNNLYSGHPWGEGWLWDDIPYSYNSPISALAVNENKITVNITPGYQIGTTASINLPFTNTPFTIDNKIVTSNTDTTLTNISYLPHNSTVTFTGKIKQDSAPIKEELSIINPELFAKNIFLHLLTINHITVTEQTEIPYSITSNSMPAINNKLNSPVMISHISPPLIVIGKRMLYESNNFLADMLLKNIGAKCSGKGSFAGGTASIRAFLSQLGIPENGYNIVDGSGLSRYNLISPSLITHYLTAIHTTPLQTHFISLLPQPGQGTLTYRLNDNSVSVWAKTGSMSNISTIAGYLGKNNTPMFSFAIFINNSLQSTDTLKKVEDEIIKKLSAILIGNNLVTESR